MAACRALTRCHCARPLCMNLVKTGSKRTGGRQAGSERRGGEDGGDGGSTREDTSAGPIFHGDRQNEGKNPPAAGRRCRLI